MQLKTSEVGIGSKEHLFFALPSISFRTSSSESYGIFQGQKSLHNTTVNVIKMNERGFQNGKLDFN